MFVAIAEEISSPSESPMSCRASEVATARFQLSHDSHPDSDRLFVFGHVICDPAKLLLARAIILGVPTESFFGQGPACFYRGHLHPAILAWGVSVFSFLHKDENTDEHENTSGDADNILAIKSSPGYLEVCRILAGIHKPRGGDLLVPPGLAAMRRLCREFSGSVLAQARL